MSEIEDQNEWVLDSLIGFIKSPIWNATIDAFVEQKSVVFDSDEIISEELAQEYRVIYEEYKTLVDRLLSGLMSDLEISEQQFDEVCKNCSHTKGFLANRLQKNFEQIYASNDFNIFVSFMAKTNTELQLQALDILAQKYGLVYDSFIPHGSNKDDYLSDDNIIKNVIQKSLREQEDNNEEEVNKEKYYEESVETDKKFDIKENMEVWHEKSRLEAQHDKLSLAIRSAMINDINDSSNQVVKEETQLPPLKARPLADKTIDLTTATPESIKSVGNKSDDDESIENESIKKRAEYLRNQRDKLVTIKKKEREKQLSKMEEQDLLLKRPKSAKIMRSVIEEKNDQNDDQSDQSLAFRRSLAARLKAEVIESQNEK